MFKNNILPLLIWLLVRFTTPTWFLSDVVNFIDFLVLFVFCLNFLFLRNRISKIDYLIVNSIGILLLFFVVNYHGCKGSTSYSYRVVDFPDGFVEAIEYLEVILFFSFVIIELKIIIGMNNIKRFLDYFAPE